MAAPGLCRWAGRRGVDHVRIRRRRRRRAEFARHLLLIVVTFLLVAPFYYVFLASLKNSTAIFSYPPKPAADSRPISTTTTSLLWNTGFLRWMFNTLFVAVQRDH